MRMLHYKHLSTPRNVFEFLVNEVLRIREELKIAKMDFEEPCLLRIKRGNHLPEIYNRLFQKKIF